jgi:hypothetical protein
VSRWLFNDALEVEISPWLCGWFRVGLHI